MKQKVEQESKKKSTTTVVTVRSQPGQATLTQWVIRGRATMQSMWVKGQDGGVGEKTTTRRGCASAFSVC